MKFIVLFEDALDAAPDTRQANMKHHLAFLDKNSNQIEAAGPLSDPDSKGRDGLWIVEAETREEIDALVHQDPFWPTGLRQSYSIILWNQVFVSGRRNSP